MSVNILRLKSTQRMEELQAIHLQELQAMDAANAKEMRGYQLHLRSLTRHQAMMKAQKLHFWARRELKERQEQEIARVQKDELREQKQQMEELRQQEAEIQAERAQRMEELRQRVAEGAKSRAQSQQVFLELQILREKRRADDKTEQIASREKQRAQYAKELPGKQEETRRVIRQMQQERANRTGEDVNEIARQAEEQHKAFTERPKQEPNTRVLMKCYTFRELIEIGRVKDDDNEELLLQPLQAQAIALENL